MAVDFVPSFRILLLNWLALLVFGAGCAFCLGTGMHHTDNVGAWAFRIMAVMFGGISLYVVVSIVELYFYRLTVSESGITESSLFRRRFISHAIVKSVSIRRVPMCFNTLITIVADDKRISVYRYSLSPDPFPVIKSVYCHFLDRKTETGS